MSNKMQAAFMVAPMAIALRAQGVPIKIVYLGHRYGSAVVVAKNGPIHTFADLRGRTIAIPSRFSDERLIIFRALKQNGMSAKDIKMVEMAPPDVAGALAAGAIDAFSMGEPYPSQAEMAGFGRVLFHAREYWPDYISCVLVVRQDVIDNRPRGGAGARRRHRAIGPVARRRQAAPRARRRFRRPLLLPPGPELLRWALTKPLDRVMYQPLTPAPKGFRADREPDARDRRARSPDRVRGVRRHPVRRGRDARDGMEVRAGRRDRTVEADGWFLAAQIAGD